MSQSEAVEPPTKQKKSDNPKDVTDRQMRECKVVSTEDAFKLMNEDVKIVADTLQIRDVEARCLLQHFKYNTNELYQSYFENESDVLKRVELSISSGSVDEMVADSKKCLICLSESEDSKISLICHHQACLKCYRNYITQAVENGRKKIYCFQLDCFNVMGDDVLKSIVPAEIYTKFQHILVHDYLIKKDTLVMCYTCGKTLDVRNATLTEVICNCNTKLCVLCGLEAHSPADCDMFTDWTRLFLNEDVKSLEWVQLNTKLCPNSKCKSRIFKDGGCMKITCKCGHQFCFACLKDWTDHNAENCEAIARQVEAAVQKNFNDTKFEALFKNYVLLRGNSKFSLDLQLEVLKTIDDESQKTVLREAFKFLTETYSYLAFCYVLLYYETDSTKTGLLQLNIDSLKTTLDDLEVVVKKVPEAKTLTQVETALKNCRLTLNSVTATVDP